MPTNLELKAVYPDLKKGEVIARRLGARKALVLKQTDTYFNVPKGWLKLREINSRLFELIFYQRANRNGSRFSDFIVVPLQDPSSPKDLCTKLFGKKIIVHKRRILYLYQNSRIHLDEVAGLGKFLEFEVLVKKGNEQAYAIMRKLVQEFKIVPDSIIVGSYCDLLLDKARKRKPRKIG